MAGKARQILLGIGVGDGGVILVKQVTHICMTGTDGILKQFAHFVCRFNAAANKRRIFGLNTACGDKADDILREVHQQIDFARCLQELLV